MRLRILETYSKDHYEKCIDRFFHFSLNRSYIQSTNKLYKCKTCNQISLERLYLKIIFSLISKNLLPEDFKLECCDCYSKRLNKENENSKTNS